MKIEQTFDEQETAIVRSMQRLPVYPCSKEIDWSVNMSCIDP